MKKTIVMADGSMPGTDSVFSHFRFLLLFGPDRPPRRWLLQQPQPLSFPLAQGTYWVYQGTVKWQEGQQHPPERYHFGGLKSWRWVQRQHVTAYRLKGFPTDLAFYEAGEEAPDHVFVRVGSNKFFETDLETMDRIKNPDDDLLNLVGQGQLMLELPLVVDNVFGESEQNHPAGWDVRLAGGK